MCMSGGKQDIAKNINDIFRKKFILEITHKQIHKYDRLSLFPSFFFSVYERSEGKEERFKIVFCFCLCVHCVRSVFTSHAVRPKNFPSPVSHDHFFFFSFLRVCVCASWSVSLFFNALVIIIISCCYLDWWHYLQNHYFHFRSSTL